VSFRKKRLYPSVNRLIKYYLPGIIVVITGSIIFFTLNSEKSYWITHSIWHICMALSILFFLPNREMIKFNFNHSNNHHSIAEPKSLHF
jgi:hypothetical protein